MNVDLNTLRHLNHVRVASSTAESLLFYTSKEQDPRYSEITGPLPSVLDTEAKIGSAKGFDIKWITLLLVSLNLKHIKFIELAINEFPDISVPQSLTTWHINDEVVDQIADFTKIPKKQVKEVINMITFKATDAELLKRHSSLIMPLLIDLDNGYMLPISAIWQNPFYSIMVTLEHLNSNFRHDISFHREQWQRQELYAEFQGNRYQLTEGNINLRKAINIVTDIDAAIFDNTPGELALFQIKWQNFFYNDVKKLRSKASNLVRKLDEWTEKVNRWIQENGLEELQKRLKIKESVVIKITSVYLLGLSRNVSTTSGYGFNVKSEHLAVANWASFRKTRIMVGPAKYVISTLFENLKLQAGTIY